MVVVEKTESGVYPSQMPKSSNRERASVQALGGEAEAAWPVDVRPWFVPLELRLQGENVVWNELGEHKKVAIGPGLLGQFLDLSTAGDKSILRFAKRWGVLELCTLALPLGHTQRIPGCGHGPDGAASYGCPMPRYNPPLDRGFRGVGLNDMRRYATHAKALLFTDQKRRGNSVPVLKRGEQLLSEWTDYRALAVEKAYRRDKTASARMVDRLRDRGVGGSSVRRDMNRWLALSDIHLTVEDHEDKVLACLGGGTLFDALVSQLFAAVIGIRGFAFCVGCKRWHEPDSTVIRGYSYYCSKWPGEAKRAAKRRSRAGKDLTS
jgi:hypothetical protein